MLSIRFCYGIFGSSILALGCTGAQAALNVWRLPPYSWQLRSINLPQRT
ncbi:MAG: hypothetical protein AAFR63_07925 [Cyanobacteria bacterium J06631_6]